jgi:hypothetical protein
MLKALHLVCQVVVAQTVADLHQPPDPNSIVVSGHSLTGQADRQAHKHGHSALEHSALGSVSPSPVHPGHADKQAHQNWGQSAITHPT